MWQKKEDYKGQEIEIFNIWIINTFQVIDTTWAWLNPTNLMCNILSLYSVNPHLDLTVLQNTNG